MSTESIIDLKHDSVDSASVTKSESAEDIDNAENTTNRTEKFADLYRKLQAEFVTADEAEILKKIDIIIEYEELLDDYLVEMSISKDTKLDDFIILAECFMSMHYIKCSINRTECEHLYIARFFAMQSKILLKNKELDSKVILTAISTLNALGIICVKLKDEQLSVHYFNEALNLYMTYTKGQDDFPAPINILVLMGLEVQANTVYILNKKYITTLKYLIMLSHKIKHIDVEKIITYMHKLLKKQLEDISEAVDYVSWSLDAVRLAEYLLSYDRFVECKNHLGLASVIITRFHDNFCKIDEALPPVKTNALYEYKNMICTIKACWVRYGLALLFSSRKRLLSWKGLDNISKANSCESELTTQSVKQSTRSCLMFSCAEEEYKTFIRITEDDYITHHDEAKRILVIILKLVKEIKTDNSISKEAEVHFEIAQYISKAYKYFAFYVHDKVTQIKLQKRRIDILEDCLTTLDEKKNMIIYSIIWFELTLINTTILNIMFENINEDKPSAKELKEINQLVEKNKTYLQLYIDNYKIVEYALQNSVIDGSYQVISMLNTKYVLRK